MYLPISYSLRLSNTIIPIVHLSSFKTGLKILLFQILNSVIWIIENISSSSSLK